MPFLAILETNLLPFWQNMKPFIALYGNFYHVANSCHFWQLSEAKYCQKWQKSDLHSL